MHPALFALLAGFSYVGYKGYQAVVAKKQPPTPTKKLDWSSFKISPNFHTFINQVNFQFAPNVVRSVRDVAEVQYEKYEDPLYRCFANFPSDGSSYDPHYVIDNVVQAGRPDYILRNYSMSLQNVESIGYEYLNEVPPSADARVNAMRQKIEQYALANLAPTGTTAPTDGSKIDVSDYVKFISDPSIDTSSQPHPVLASFTQQSAKQVVTLVNKITNSISNPSKIGDLAKSMGIDVSQIQKDVAIAQSIISTIDAATGGEATQLLTQAGETIVSYIGTAIESTLEALGVDIASILPDLAEVAGDIASIIPIAGAVVKVIIDLVKIMSASSSDNAAVCKQMTDRIQNIYLKNYSDSAYQLPIPWHLLQTWKPDCPNGAGVWHEFDNPVRPANIILAPDRMGNGGATGFITEVLRSRFNQFNALPVDAKNAIKKWWAMAQSSMSHPEIFKIFISMCNDSMGGTMANDEQVMCVAAPIAIANGFDIDGFAKLLWNYSLGYQDSSNQDVTTRYLNGILSCFHYYYTGVGQSLIFDNMLTPFDESAFSPSGVFGNYWDGDRTIPPPAPGTNTINALDQTYSDDPMGWWQPYCQNVIDNAWVANWGILCRDAFELAKRIKQSNRRHGLPLTNLSNVEV